MLILNGIIYAQESQQLTVKIAESFITMISDLDTDRMQELFHENLVYEDKTAPFIWDKEKAITFFKGRKEAGIAEKRELVVNDIYLINSNIADIHGTWLGEHNGKSRSVKFSTTIIMHEGKIARWTDHYDMAAFK